MAKAKRKPSTDGPQKITGHQGEEKSFGSLAYAHLLAAENALLCPEARSKLYQLASDYCLAQKEVIDGSQEET